MAQIKKEDLAAVLYFAHVAEHGFPNGLRLWDDLPDDYKYWNNVVHTQTKQHWMGIAGTLSSILTIYPPKQPTKTAPSKTDA